MPLTTKQLEALPHIEWLIGNGYRAEGRTELLCHAFIRKAIRNPGMRVSVFDHYGLNYVMRHIFPSRLIAILTSDYPEWDLVWYAMDNSFQLRPRAVIVADYADDAEDVVHG